MHVYFILFVQAKYTKMLKQDTPSIGRNVLEFFCMPLYIEVLFDFNKKFQISSTHDTNLEY